MKKSFTVQRFCRKSKPLGDHLSLAIGNFDGLHYGHKALISSVIDSASQRNITPAVMLFEPQTHEFFSKKSGVVQKVRLMSLSDKLNALKILGIERVIIVHFDEKVASLSAEEFIHILVKKYNLKHLVIGEDFAFGKNHQGNAKLLNKLGHKFGFDLTLINDISADSDRALSIKKRISSTSIRKYLISGDLISANLQLVFPYHISGRVVRGVQRGRTIGFPTANISYNKTIVLDGVFVVSVYFVDGTLVSGVANIGKNPTFGADSDTKIEVHLLDFSQDIYDKKVCIFFHERLRMEKKFDSVEHLIDQIHHDTNRSRVLANKYLPALRDILKKVN